MIYQKFTFGGQPLCFTFLSSVSILIMAFRSALLSTRKICIVLFVPLQRNFLIRKSFPFMPVTFKVVNMKSASTLSPAVRHNLPPAIPYSLPVSADGQRWFLVDSLTADPFAERIVGHYHRSRKYDLGGQLSLWEHESKKTV